MGKTEEIFIGWDAAMKVLENNNVGITGNLLSSIHFDVLKRIMEAKVLPIAAYDYENFIKAMKGFCLKHLELKKIYTFSGLVAVNDEGILADVSTRIAISMLEMRVSLAEDLGLLLRTKEALAVIKDTFKQDYIVAKVLVLALKELINYIEDVYSTDTKPLDCLFSVEVLKEWASNKDFIQGVFNGVDYSWFPDEDTESSTAKQVLAR